MAKKLVIYHKHCWDGFCAAWLFHLVWPQAEFMPAQYGDAPPDCTGKAVYIADFSYPRDVLWNINVQADSLVVLDHHQSAEKDLAGFDVECASNNAGVPTIVFDLSKSGAHLTLDYLQAHAYLQPEVWPWLMQYTEDRDLWRWALPKSREVNAAIRSYPLDFALWDELAQMDPLGILVQEGAAILRREEQIIADHVAHAYEVQAAGFPQVPMVNATTLFSDIAGALCKGRPFAVCYFDREDGKRQYSLRSDENGMDVSEVAKAWRGGGHKHAAGFTTGVHHNPFHRKETPE
jgi:hypothetical protein